MVPGMPLSLMEHFARRVGPLGLHLQLHLGQCDDVLTLAPRIETLGLPVVIDHMGSTTAAEGTQATAFRRLTDWFPDPVLRRRILVENPEQLFRFPRGTIG